MSWQSNYDNANPYEPPYIDEAETFFKYAHEQMGQVDCYEEWVIDCEDHQFYRSTYKEDLWEMWNEMWSKYQNEPREEEDEIE